MTVDISLTADIRQMKKLTLSEKVVLALYRTLKGVWPSHRKAAEILDLSERKVSDAYRVLELAGLIGGLEKNAEIPEENAGKSAENSDSPPPSPLPPSSPPDGFPCTPSLTPLLSPLTPSPTAPVKPAAAKEKKPRERNLHFDAVAEVTQLDVALNVKAIAKLAHELKSGGYDPEDVLHVPVLMSRDSFWDGKTPGIALIKSKIREARQDRAGYRTGIKASRPAVVTHQERGMPTREKGEALTPQEQEEFAKWQETLDC